MQRKDFSVADKSFLAFVGFCYLLSAIWTYLRRNIGEFKSCPLLVKILQLEFSDILTVLGAITSFPKMKSALAAKWPRAREENWTENLAILWAWRNTLKRMSLTQINFTRLFNIFQCQIIRSNDFTDSYSLGRPGVQFIYIFAAEKSTSDEVWSWIT